MELTLQMIDPAIIVGHPSNPRRDVGPLTELTASIKAKGILEPLVVCSGSDVSGWVLIAGHRRLEAAKKAKLKTVPCIIREDLVTAAQQIEAMLVENLQRADLSPVEEADGYQALLEFDGYDVAAVSKATGRSQKTIKARLAVAHMPDAVKAKVHGGQISLTDAAKLAQFADEPAMVEHLASKLGGYNFQYDLQDAKSRAKRIAAALDAGAVVVTDKDALQSVLESLPGYVAPDTYPVPEPVKGDVLFWPVGGYRRVYGPPAVEDLDLAGTEDDDTDDDVDAVDDPPSDDELDELAAAAGERPIVDVPLPGDKLPKKAAGGSMVEKRRAKEERDAAAAKAKLAEQLQIAADARWQVVCDVVAGKEIPLVKPEHAAAMSLRFTIGENLYEYGCDDPIAELFGEAVEPRDTLIDRIMVRAESMDVTHLALALAAFNGQGQQGTLLRPWGWDGANLEVGRRWLNVVEDVFGYELSDVERTMLAQDTDQ